MKTHNNQHANPKPYIRKAFEMMEGARPKSGSIPETPEEWNKLLAAAEEMAYAMYRDQGMDKRQARNIAKAVHGGDAGMLLLRLAFRDE